MKVKSILVSQPKPQAENSPYYEIEKKNKIKIDFRPFIQVVGIDAKEVRQQKLDFNKATAVIFTSRNAIDHFFRLAEEMRFTVPDSMKYFCESEAIAFYLQKYIVYRKRKIYIGEKVFSDLLPLFKKHKDEKFILPASDVLKPDVPNLLDSLKLDWQKATLFRTVSSDLSDLSDVKYDILVFFTPSGIKSLFENFPSFVQNETRIAVFGKSTAAQAKEMGLRVDIEVPSPQTPSMTMALEKYIKEANKSK
ncbi:uroporphyrinogen-III synthase [Chishuiella changwenlii]|jgi:uroporphyrinogen-III synthase|uniref:Uroporphyrinogen III methyltransferase n=1 Tax=Chishuiella changwenlii TaxID=1434701 RepID=A0A1M6ZZI4_9FLAO|nr:uroporphyrinogen-III synthase [Chishuiella changwenlii]GGE92112.1 uroporphyrinogen III methyltransferase [Chishuiella changwenlii]SHL35745.1 uroporphyrinogen-III synthase [Chishuiella changwenlii]